MRLALRSAGTIPKSRPDSERHGDGEEEHAVVRRELEREPLVARDRQTLERAGPRDRDQRAAEAAGEEQRQRFGEELADEARAAGTESRADPHLAPSCCGAHREQRRDVRGRDDQHQRRRTKQHRAKSQQRLPRIVWQSGERRESDAGVANELVATGGGPSCREGREFAARLRGVDAGLQPPERPEPRLIGDVALRMHVRLRRQRHPGVSFQRSEDTAEHRRGRRR